MMNAEATNETDEALRRGKEAPIGGTPATGDVMTGEEKEMMTSVAAFADGSRQEDSQAFVPYKELPVAFRATKRAFDIVSATLGLAILSPLFLGVSIAVKITSPGPVIFKQERYGRGKQPFVCYKFRSMTVETPSNIPSRMMGERKSVMTPIGATLRKTSIDELPQLVNIVKGDMSVVGPRPMILAEYDQIQARDRYGANDIRPGLTGWAQVNGRDSVTVEEKARLDGEYRRNMGPAMDVNVLLRSVVVVLGRLGYGVEQKIEDDGNSFEAPETESKHV